MDERPIGPPSAHLTSIRAGLAEAGLGDTDELVTGRFLAAKRTLIRPDPSPALRICGFAGTRREHPLRYSLGLMGHRITRGVCRVPDRDGERTFLPHRSLRAGQSRVTLARQALTGNGRSAVTAGRHLSGRYLRDRVRHERDDERHQQAEPEQLAER